MTGALPEPDDHDPDGWESPARHTDVHGWIPFTDAASRTILNAAVLDLVTYRDGCDDDAGVAISVLVSLLAEGECWLPELVANARDQSYPSPWGAHIRPPAPAGRSGAGNLSRQGGLGLPLNRHRRACR